VLAHSQEGADEKACHLVKGTHAQDFNSLFLTLFCVGQSSIDTKHSIANIFQNLSQIRPDIPSFNHFPFSSKARNITKRYCQKHAAMLSVVFATARFRIVLSVFGEKAE
jgi:hypothetical protein